MNVCMCTHGGQKRALSLPELELANSDPLQKQDSLLTAGSFLLLCMRPFRLHTGGFKWILKLYSLPSWWENQGLDAVWIGVWWRLPLPDSQTASFCPFMGKELWSFSPTEEASRSWTPSHWELGFNVWIWSGAVMGAHPVYSIWCCWIFNQRLSRVAGFY